MTQVVAARRLRVSQPYLSLVERGWREPTYAFLKRAAQVYVDPGLLPLADDPRMSLDGLAGSLGDLGYPGFAYLSQGRPRVNPAVVLVAALRRSDLEARLAEAMPWLLLHFADLEHEWLLRQARMLDLTNKLGFVVALAERVLLRRGGGSRLHSRLRDLERRLAGSRLAREESFGSARPNPVEREWLRTHRSPEAVRWNLLSDFTAEDLRYVA